MLKYNKLDGVVMIETYREIISENPILQIWKLLRNYLDVSYTSYQIRNIHGLPEKEQKMNVKKQAIQIGYCIRQAQEYFNASSEVELPTRPLLLYYGVVSLSTALVLLKQTGDYSLDALRKHNKHQHHGLDFHIASLNKDYLSIDIEHLYGSLECTYHIQNNIPWGLFNLFYQSLVPCCYAFKREIHDAGKVTYVTGHDLLQCADMLEMSALIGKTFNMLDLAKYLPDMHNVFRDLGTQAHLCQGNTQRKTTRHYKKDEQGKDQLEKTIEETDFFIDGIDETTKQQLLPYYNTQNDTIKVVADLGRNVHLKHKIEYTERQELTYWLPDAVNAISGAQFYVLNPESYIHEPAAFFMLLYCLGMLARYYPYLWIHIIDHNVGIAEFTDSLLNVIQRKFPNLILDQMTSTKHHIHI